MHFKQNNKESRLYVQGLRPFKSTIPKNLKKIFNKKGYIYGELVGKWNILVGKQLAEISFPKSIQIKNTREGSTLCLSIQRGNEIEIEYSKKDIIDKINSYFGYNLVEKIKIDTFSSTKNNDSKNQNVLKHNLKKFEKQINSIKNNNIKNALFNLINTIKK